MARLPCAWLYLGGHTFRWGRGDQYMDVLAGDVDATHEDDHRVGRIEVRQEGWSDISDLATQARKWLRATAAQRAREQ
ncbi:hypothetical protein [Saccharopolyspora sp. 5N708]|uniref:hypothetical protein n=1 Tax=Saccharopolyspora sp. 5N708 TaxID=3457424 RepID=UPI003FD29E37